MPTIEGGRGAKDENLEIVHAKSHLEVTQMVHPTEAFLLSSETELVPWVENPRRKRFWQHRWRGRQLVMR